MNEAISADPGVDCESRPAAAADGVHGDRNPAPSHIAFYLPELTGGGVQRRTLTLAGELAGQGHRIDLVLCQAEGTLRDQVPPQVRVVCLDPEPLWRARCAALAADPKGLASLTLPVLLAKKPSRSLAYLSSLARYLRNERPHALLAAKPHPNLEAVWARNLAHAETRIVVSERIALSGKVSTSRMWKRRYLPPLIKRTYQMADGIIAVSQGVADDLAAVTSIPRGRISTIYNPVVGPELLEKAAAPLDHPWFAPGSPPVVLGAGRIHPDKDFPTLLRAFARVRKQRPARLMILGEARRDERHKALLELAEELDIAGDLVVPGFVGNPYAYMSRAAVFVLSSLWEGLPGVLIEALACGCPTVSTDCPSGPREILENGDYGVLVPMGDDAAMAEGILATLADPPDKDRLRARGAEFGIERSARQYLELLLGDG